MTETTPETTGDDPRDRVADMYERYAGHIAAYALRRTDRVDAADVTAETFLVAWRRRDDVPDEPDTLPWLYGVARRVLANQRRTRRRRGRLRERLESQFVDHDVDPIPLEGAEDLRAVVRALERLPGDDAELLRLSSWEGLNSTEIGAMLGLPAGTVRQRLSRARQRLRRQLASDGHDPDPAGPPAVSIERRRGSARRHGRVSGRTGSRYDIAGATGGMTS